MALISRGPPCFFAGLILTLATGLPFFRRCDLAGRVPSREGAPGFSPLPLIKPGAGNCSYRICTSVYESFEASMWSPSRDRDSQVKSSSIILKLETSRENKEVKVR